MNYALCQQCKHHEINTQLWHKGTICHMAIKANDLRGWVDRPLFEHVIRFYDGAFNSDFHPPDLCPYQLEHTLLTNEN